jgi:DNA-binding transcriptional ArsR family regulator
MSAVEESQQLDLIFAALAHRKRRAIVYDLSFKPSTISRLAAKYDLSFPAIYKHIRLLEISELIIKKKSGRTNFIALNQITLSAGQAWMKQYKTEWGNPEATLENYIAKLQE